MTLELFGKIITILFVAFIVYFIYRIIKNVVVRTKKYGFTGFIIGLVPIALLIFIFFFDGMDKIESFLGNEKVEETKIESTTKQNVTPTAPAQPTGDPLKDELLWPIGKFGYHEPPMELRNYNDPNHPNRYRIALHSDKYGDLEMAYDETSGKRVLFTAGGTSTDQLLIAGKDNKSTNAELLEDLKMGDSIARNFGK